MTAIENLYNFDWPILELTEEHSTSLEQTPILGLYVCDVWDNLVWFRADFEIVFIPLW